MGAVIVILSERQSKQSPKCGTAEVHTQRSTGPKGLAGEQASEASLRTRDYDILANNGNLEYLGDGKRRRLEA